MADATKIGVADATKMGVANARVAYLLPPPEPLNVQWIVADSSDMATTHVCDVNRLLISLDSDWAGILGQPSPSVQH